MSKTNRVVKILMKRDGISAKEAEQLVQDTRDEMYAAIEEGQMLSEIDDIIATNLELEPDYIFDILSM